MRAMEVFFSSLLTLTSKDAIDFNENSVNVVVKNALKAAPKIDLDLARSEAASSYVAPLVRPVNAVTDVVVFYTGCCGEGKGDYSACGTLVEMISSYVPYHVILLSNVRGVEQFNSLYQKKNQTASINGKRVEIMALYDFRDNQHKFSVKGYVEHGCSRLGSHHMEEYVLKNSDAKAAIVLTMIQGGLPNYLSETKDGYRYTPKVSVFAAGFGPRMSGVPFAHSPLVSMGVFQEKTGFSLENFLTLNPNYGFAYVTCRPSFGFGNNDRQMAALYLKDYMSIIHDLNESRVVLCFGSKEIALIAAADFEKETNKKVCFIDVSEENNKIFSVEEDAFLVIFSQGVSNDTFKSLMQKASKVVALPGASSAVEAMGAKKLVFYECVKESPSFAGGFHDLMTAPLHSDLIDFGKLLVHEKKLAADQLILLKKYLKNESLCSALANISEMRVQSESKRLTRSLLNWLQVEPLAPQEKVSAASPSFYQ